MITKTCPHCKTTKLETEFYRHGHYWSGWCKSCTKERSHQQAQKGYFRANRASKEHHPRIPKVGRNLRLLNPQEKCCYKLWLYARTRAMMSGAEFTITRDFVTKLVNEFCSSTHHSFETLNPFKPSLDRIDHNKGYISDNVQVLWMIENLAKNRFTDSQVIEFCKRKLGLDPTN